MRDSARRAIALLFLTTPWLASAAAQTADPTEAHLFVLVLDEGGFRLDPLRITEGESRTLTIDRDGTVVDLVHVVGPGQSGNLVQRSTNRYTVTVSRTGEAYHTSVATPTGGSRELPAARIADLATYQIRVSATAADGRKAAFVIDNGVHASRDDEGPVLDMFRGMIPMRPGDVSITTQTSVQEPPRTSLRGEAELSYDGGLLFVNARWGEFSGEFIVDFAAGTTVIERSALPAGVAIEALEGVEYSAEGKRTIPATMQGAGGEVQGHLGQALLPELAVGSLTLRDVRVAVLSELPEIAGHTPAGILGMNVLSRADFASIWFPDEGRAGRLRLASESCVSEDEAWGVRFRRVGNHLFVKGEIDEVPATLIFDTGARRAHLHPRIAEAAHLTVRSDDDPDGTRGLDGNEMKTGLVTAKNLRLGERTFDNVDFVVADMPVFASLGVGTDVGLLGNNFLDRFSVLEVDFTNEVIRLVR